MYGRITKIDSEAIKFTHLTGANQGKVSNEVTEQNVCLCWST